MLTVRIWTDPSATRIEQLPIPIVLGVHEVLHHVKWEIPVVSGGGGVQRHNFCHYLLHIQNSECSSVLCSAFLFTLPRCEYIAVVTIPWDVLMQWLSSDPFNIPTFPRTLNYLTQRPSISHPFFLQMQLLTWRPFSLRYQHNFIIGIRGSLSPPTCHLQQSRPKSVNRSSTWLQILRWEDGRGQSSPGIYFPVPSSLVRGFPDGASICFMWFSWAMHIVRNRFATSYIHPQWWGN